MRRDEGGQRPSKHEGEVRKRKQGRDAPIAREFLLPSDMSKAALQSQGSLGSRVIPVISQTQQDFQETLIRNDRRQRSLRIKARNSQSYIGKLTVWHHLNEFQN
eukprot:558458-Hanusia_phi.AAC.2